VTLGARAEAFFGFLTFTEPVAFGKLRASFPAPIVQIERINIAAFLGGLAAPSSLC
jgi:hypothetical protein